MTYSEASHPQEIDESPSHRLDRVSVLLALVTLVLVGWTAWLRFGPASRPEPPAVGLALPPLRLLTGSSNSLPKISKVSQSHNHGGTECQTKLLGPSPNAFPSCLLTLGQSS